MTIYDQSAEASPGDDILRGAKAIAAFLLGDSPKNVRRIYHMVENSLFPSFRIGRAICARKSVLLAWIAGQEGGVRRNAA